MLEFEPGEGFDGTESMGDLIRTHLNPSPTVPAAALEWLPAEMMGTTLREWCNMDETARGALLNTFPRSREFHTTAMAMRITIDLLEAKVM